MLLFVSMASAAGTAVGAATVVKVVSDGVEDVVSIVQNGSKLVTAVEEFCSNLSTAVDKALAILQEVQNEEIKKVYEVKTALHDLIEVVEAAYAFLDKVDDVFYFCQSPSMTAAREGLSREPPDLKRLNDLMGLLGKCLKAAVDKHKAFLDICRKAIKSCDAAAAICARKAKECQNKKTKAKVVGGTTAGALMVAGGGAVGGGVAASVVAGVFTFGIGTVVGLGLTAAAGFGLGAASAAAGVGTAVATHYIASKYAESEASFRSIRWHFDSILGFAYDVKEGVAQVYTVQQNISGQIDNVKYCIDNNTNVGLIADAVKHLNEASEVSYNTTSRKREGVQAKLVELKAKVN